MRKPRGSTTKTVGYVLVPLFAGVDGDGFDDAIKTEKFDAIVDVLNSLQEHDEELIDVIRELKRDKGEGKPFNSGRILEKIEFLGPEVEFDKLVQSITMKVIDRLGVDHTPPALAARPRPLERLYSDLALRASSGWRVTVGDYSNSEHR
jgi:hypothetical protein